MEPVIRDPGLENKIFFAVFILLRGGTTFFHFCIIPWLLSCVINFPWNVLPSFSPYKSLILLSSVKSFLIITLSIYLPLLSTTLTTYTTLLGAHYDISLHQSLFHAVLLQSEHDGLCDLNTAYPFSPVVYHSPPYILCSLTFNHSFIQSLNHHPTNIYQVATTRQAQSKSKVSSSHL